MFNQMAFKLFPIFSNALTHRSMSSNVCDADICTRMRAFPLGTTG